MRRITLSLILVMLTAYPSHSMTIRRDPGGYIHRYDAKYRALARRGEQLKIDGPCVSACTTFLSIVPASRVCVTKRASLGVHMAASMTPYGFQPNAQLTRHMVNRYYPGWVKSWIVRHGGLVPRPKFITSAELRQHFRSC